MPTVSIGFETVSGAFSAEALIRYGPTLLVEIGFDPTFAPGQVSRPNLSTQTFPALLDTGADINCIDSNLASELGLRVLEQRIVAGLGGDFQTGIYLAQIYIPPLQVTLSGEFAGIISASRDMFHRAIIGRNFLRDFAMVYDGRTGVVTLSND